MSREIFDLPPYSEIWKDTKKRTPLSKERELLREIMCYIASGVVSITSNDLGDAAETLHEIQELLAQPETKQEPVAWQLVANFITDGDILQYTYSKPRDELYEYYRVTPLYTSPPTRDPLSDEEITKNTPKLIHIGERLAFHAGVRFSERHHIIGVDDEH